MERESCAKFVSLRTSVQSTPMPLVCSALWGEGPD